MDLKPKISNVTRIPIDELRIFERNDATNPVADGYRPRPGDILTVLLPTITITLPNTNELLEFEASPGTTIGDIKEVLVEETGIRKSNQKLFSLEENDDKESNDVDCDDVCIKKDMKLKLLNILEDTQVVQEKNYGTNNVVAKENESI